MLEHFYQGKQAALTVDDESVNDKPSLLLDIIPGKMSHLLPLSIAISGCSPCIALCGVEHHQVLVSHHSKYRVARAAVGQLVVLNRKIKIVFKKRLSAPFGRLSLHLRNLCITHRNTPLELF